MASIQVQKVGRSLVRAHLHRDGELRVPPLYNFGGDYSSSQLCTAQDRARYYRVPTPVFKSIENRYRGDGEWGVKITRSPFSSLLQL